jgi:hypothetical protein
MEDKKNIDRLFQERFKNFEASAPADAWDNIEARLDRKDPPAMLPLWWKLAGVAAVLAVIFSVFFWNGNETIPGSQMVIENPKDLEGDSISQPIKNNRDIAVEQGTSESTDEGNSKDLPARNNEVKNTNQIVTNSTSRKNKEAGDSNKKSAAAENIQQNDYAATEPVVGSNPVNNNKANPTERFSNEPKNNNRPEKNEPIKNNAAVASNSENAVAEANNKEKDTDISDTSQPSLEDIAAAKKETLLDKDLFTKKWSAATMVAPVYANTIGGSSINNQVSDNTKISEVNLSYGMAVAYEFAPRWSVRTGVNQVNMNYNTQDISYGLDATTLSVAGATPSVAYNPDAVNNETNNALNDSFAQELVSVATFSSFKGELSQQLGYIEVPLEVKYRLVDNKFGVSILGGMSALFLTDNEVSVTNDGRKLVLGEDNNFQDFNQSANFGIGIDYRFTEKLGFSVEPTFKYQLNALSNDTADFKPYTIGVYTGLMYRF